MYAENRILSGGRVRGTKRSLTGIRRGGFAHSRKTGRFLDIMELWYRDLLTAKSLREEGYLIQRDKKDAIFRAAKEPAALLAKKAAAVRTARMRLAQNANFRLTMEVMLMDLKETGK